jgi:hypothetical protein
VPFLFKGMLWGSVERRIEVVHGVFNGNPSEAERLGNKARDKNGTFVVLRSVM